MKRIGIISDTHSYFDDKLYKYLSECDEIWHAGDIGEQVQTLVRFTIDGSDMRDAEVIELA